MAGKGNPGAPVGGATGAGMPCFAEAAGTRNLSPDALHGNALARHLAPFAAALDPATLAALGLVATRLWGALQ